MTSCKISISLNLRRHIGSKRLSKSPVKLNGVVEGGSPLHSLGTTTSLFFFLTWRRTFFLIAHFFLQHFSSTIWSSFSFYPCPEHFQIKKKKETQESLRCLSKFYNFLPAFICRKWELGCEGGYKAKPSGQSPHPQLTTSGLSQPEITAHLFYFMVSVYKITTGFVVTLVGLWQLHPS